MKFPSNFNANPLVQSEYLLSITSSLKFCTLPVKVSIFIDPSISFPFELGLYESDLSTSSEDGPFNTSVSTLWKSSDIL